MFILVYGAVAAGLAAGSALLVALAASSVATNIVAAAGIAIALVALFYAVVLAPRQLRRTDVEVPIAGLSPAFDGYTIAVISDLHHGGVFWPRSHAERAAAIARSADPDLVALLGDYGVSAGPFTGVSRYMYDRAMRELTPVLRSIKARDGTLAVLGNHDYSTGAWRVVRWLSSLGVGVLLNRAALFERDGAQLVIGGVHDPHHARVDPEGGFAHAPEGAPRILLSHTPDAINLLSPTARVSLVISGHTHGGQVVFPLIGALARHSKICGRLTASGWVPNPHAPLYVTTGVGVSFPVRTFCRPEVVIVRLRSGVQGSGFRVQGRARCREPSTPR